MTFIIEQEGEIVIGPDGSVTARGFSIHGDATGTANEKVEAIINQRVRLAAERLGIISKERQTE